MHRKGFGRVVNISSVHGLWASPYKSAYIAAKHGLEGLSKVTALEGADHGITSNTVCPAYVRTPLVEGQISDQAEAHDISESAVIEDVMLTEPAIKRLVEPERWRTWSRSAADRPRRSSPDPPSPWMAAGVPADVARATSMLDRTANGGPGSHEQGPPSADGRSSRPVVS